MSMFTYGRMVPVRGLDIPTSKALQTTRYRKPELAIREKMKVLEGFGIVDDRNREAFERDMLKAIETNPDVHFDRVLDGFARRLISKKLGG